MEKPVIGVPQGWGWIGWLIAFVTIITTYLVNRRKVRVDESALVLDEWKKLYDAHEKRIEGYEHKIEGYEKQIELITSEFALYRKQAASESRDLRTRLTGAEKRIGHLEEMIIQKDKYIAGLEAQIGQITQSSAVILTGNHASDDIAGAAKRSARERGRKGGSDG